MRWTFSKNGSGKDSEKKFESKREGSRRRGRPRLRWLEDVEKDLRERKVKKWRQKEFDREEQASRRLRLSEGRRVKE